ncbi:MAG: heme/hemin ABC transporter substrate-binding protein [Elsteraceae bacterium]
MNRFTFALAALLTVAALPASAERIVAVGGSVTEIVYALGAGDQLVGVDTTSLFPAKTEALPKVGYLRALTAEGLLTLRPELILAAQEAGPASALTQVGQAGVKTAMIGVDLLPGSIADRIRAVGAALGKSAQAEAMATAFADDLATITAAAGRTPKRAKVLFLLSASSGSILASGRRTAADAIIEAAGGANAISGYEGYKPASAEAVAMADPDVILMTSQTFDAIGGIDKIRKLPGVLATRAAREDRVIRFESGYLLGLGPRTAHAVRDLAQALAPDAPLPALPARPWTRAE